MTIETEGAACSCYFETRHEVHTHPAMRALERDVLGCDFGGTSWTTQSQADEIPPTLDLNSSSHLLEIGAGTGWPSLYVAKAASCRVTLVDILVSALGSAQKRARLEGMEQLCTAVASSGAALPFADSSFDAVSHSDVLCCLLEKRAMLKECRRVVCNGAKMLFYVIAPARGLSGPELDKACQTGPPFVGVPDSYENLLSQTGWNILSKIELSHEYLKALRRHTDGMESSSETFKQILGLDEFDGQMLQRHLQISAIEHGLLERERFLVQAV